MENIGKQMHQWMTDLFPLNRSLSGEGVRQTLNYFQNIIPELEVKSFKSGQQAFDWTVPEEWGIKEAYIADEDGRKIIDFKECNLHLVGYSEAIDEIMTFEKLDQYLYSLPEQPNAIPYITSYYKKRWGFCLTDIQRQELKKDPKKKYHVFIDSSFKDGEINYGEILIKGKTEKEILFSTYVCHPSMANNELSGPCLAIALAKYIKDHCQDSEYSFRFLFLVETIGSIAYLSENIDHMKDNVKAGYVLTCVGDERAFSYLPSRYGKTLADKAALHILKNHVPDYKSYSFLLRGSDERQYCAPGVDLPVCSVMRSKYEEYPEYHTSLDDLNLVTPQGLQGSYDVYHKIIDVILHNKTYKNTVLCEPQLGKRGLYPTISTKDTYAQVMNMMNLLAYADGQNDLIDIADILGINVLILLPILKDLVKENLLEEC